MSSALRVEPGSLVFRTDCAIGAPAAAYPILGYNLDHDINLPAERSSKELYWIIFSSCRVPMSPRKPSSRGLSRRFLWFDVLGSAPATNRRGSFELNARLGWAPTVAYPFSLAYVVFASCRKKVPAFVMLGNFAELYKFADYRRMSVDVP